MRRSHERRGAGRAVALLATSFVVASGAFTCVVIGLAAGEQSRRSLWSVAAVFAGIVLLLWFLRERRPENRSAAIWSWLARRRRRKVEYHLAPRRDAEPRPAGNAPPTAETVRQITGGINTWVPAADAKRARQSSS